MTSSIKPYQPENLLKPTKRDFPGGPGVKALPSNAGRAGSSPEQGAEVPVASGFVFLAKKTKHKTIL